MKTPVENPQDRKQTHSTAHYFLEGLQDVGFDFLFCNFGTDHAPLIEEMAAWKRQGRTPPKTLLCPHENTAVHMAGGYAFATGRGQGVMVHVDAGTANAAMGMHNLFRARLPVLLMAGRAPFTSRGELPGSRDTYVNFVQEPFDQGSIVRQYVKWEYTLSSGVIVKETLRRAHTLMHSEPRAPAYLTFARETLTEQWEPAAMNAFPEALYGPTPARGTDPQALEELVDRLLVAKAPLLIASYSGRNAEAVELLDEVAQLAGIRVVEANPTNLNISHESPCFAGFAAGPYLEQADVGILLDVDVPWIPRDHQDAPHTWWAHIDVDVEKRYFPMWSFPRHLRIQGNSLHVLRQLRDTLAARATPDFLARAAARVAEYREQAKARARHAAQLAATTGSSGAINVHFLAAAVSRAIDADAIVVNEAIRNAPAVSLQIPRTRAGTLVGLAGGGLGFSGGMALGVKLARPRQLVVQFAGDGVFYFSNPQSVYAVSKQYGLPIFTIVLDNAGWAAVKEATLRVYPDGEAHASKEYECQFAPRMAFDKIAEASGAYGELVEDPADVEAAIGRCLQAIKEGRSALLHARVTPV